MRKTHLIYKYQYVTGGNDYDSGPYNVTFPAEVTRIPFDVPIKKDNILERNETFTLMIATSLPDKVTGQGQATVTILDTDSKLILSAQKQPRCNLQKNC